MAWRTTDPFDISSGLMEPLKPHVIVLFGATGDLAQRKLLPGLLHLSVAGLVPECRIVGTSLDDLDDEAFRDLARRSCEKFSQPRDLRRPVGRVRRASSRSCRSSRARPGLAEAVAEAEAALGRRAAAGSTT